MLTITKKTKTFRDFTSCKFYEKVTPLVIKYGDKEIVMSENPKIADGVKKWLVDNITGEEGALLPEILVVGLQEMISLSPTNVIGGTVVKSLSNDHATKWSDLILTTINRYNTESTYALLASENMVGLCIHVFVDVSILGCISEVATSFLPTGTGGYLGIIYYSRTITA